MYAVAVQRAGCDAAAGSNGSVIASEFCSGDSNVTGTLADGSAALALQSVGAKLSCTLGCVADQQQQQPQPCVIVGRAAVVMDVSGAQAPAATATFGAFGLSEVARYTNATCVSAACTWLDGQQLRMPAACTAQPAASVVWCSDAGAACGPGAPTDALPMSSVANEPLQPFPVAVRTSPLDGLMALQLAEGALRCALSASVPNAGSVAVRNGDAVADAQTGLAVFTAASLQLSAAQEAAAAAAGVLTVQMNVACTISGRPFGASSPRWMRLPRLQAAWLTPPPTVMLPATATTAEPFAPILRVGLTDADNTSVLVDVSGTCSVTVVQRWLPPDAIAAGAAAGSTTLPTSDTLPGSSTIALLLGSANRPIFRGEVAFSDLALAASMGSTVTLRASCVRARGGDVASADWNVTIAHAAVAWAGLPPLLLSGRRLPLSLHVSWRLLPPEVAAQRTWRWSSAGGNLGVSGSSPVPLGEPLLGSVLAEAAVQRVSCSLTLDDVSPAPPDTVAQAVQFTSFAVSSNKTDSAATGAVRLLLDVTGASGRQARAQPVCSVGGHTFRAPAALAALATVVVSPEAPLPSVWVPSDGSAVAAVSPAPQLTLLAQDASRPDTRGAVCTVAIESAIGRQAAAALRAAVSNSESSAAVLTAANASALAVRWPPAFPASLVGAPANGYFNPPTASALAPIAVDALAIRAEFGSYVALKWSCVRANKDPTLDLIAIVRMGRLAATWATPPPRETSPGTIFAVSIALFDADDPRTQGGSSNGNASLSAGMAASAPLPGVFAADYVTVCTLVVQSVADASGRALNLSTVIIQGGSAAAVAGVVDLPTVAITARVGATVRGRVECATGSLLSPEPAPTWVVAMSACPVGSAPAGNGASCTNCGRSYSDGGPAASACVTCPSVGAACSGGVLNLLPDFYRADSNPTVDQLTELHPCGLPGACWVNASAANRSSAVTHGCTEGYAGPLCGVCAPGWSRTGKRCGGCPPAALNWFVTACIPAGVLAFGVWAARRKIDEASPFAPLTRVVLGHTQLLGALMGTFIAQGTTLVRDLLGFTEVAGASPLAIAPVQCAFGGISLYGRFFMTLALVPALMLATVGAQLLLQCRQRRAARKAATGTAAGSSGRAGRKGAQAVQSTATAAVGSQPDSARAGGTNSGSFEMESAMAATVNPLARSNSSVASMTATGSAAPRTASGLTSLTSGTATSIASDESTSQRAGCKCKPRILDDPRVTGPAVFVLVRSTRRSRVAWFCFHLCSFSSTSSSSSYPYSFSSSSLFAVFLLLPGLPMQVFLFPALVAAGFSLFSCTQRPIAGVHYLTQDLSLPCGTPTHAFMKVLGGLVIGLAGFGIPLLLALMLYRRRASLLTRPTFSSLGALYAGYDIARGRYAWEAVVMLRECLSSKLHAKW